MGDVSRCLCRLLDAIGCNQHIIEFRRQISRLLGALPGSGNRYRTVLAGSRAEGLSKWHESDNDQLLFFRFILCVDDLSLVRQLSKQTTIFAIRDTQPGYCMLELVKLGNIYDPDMRNSLVAYEGKLILPSDTIFHATRPKSSGPEITQRRSGPAQTTLFRGKDFTDMVITLPSYCCRILQNWFSRPREHDWPPECLRKAIQQMKGNLVAAGKKGSAIENLEWRFCFNKIELLLVESFNPTQVKLYKMLKMINADILKVNGHHITSYMIKNIIFWLAEKHPQSMFRPENLFRWIVKSLRLLKRSVKWNYLPYYMIPERNLLTEKICPIELESLHKDLTRLSKSGPELLFQCKKVRESAYMKPADLAVLREMNNAFEECEMLSIVTVLKFGLSGHSDDQINADDDVIKYHKMQSDLLCLTWPSHIQQKLYDCESFEEMKSVLLS